MFQIDLSNFVSPGGFSVLQTERTQTQRFCKWHGHLTNSFYSTCSPTSTTKSVVIYLRIEDLKIFHSFLVYGFLFVNLFWILRRWILLPISIGFAKPNRRSSQPGEEFDTQHNGPLPGRLCQWGWDQGAQIGTTAATLESRFWGAFEDDQILKANLNTNTDILVNIYIYTYIFIYSIYLLSN